MGGFTTPIAYLGRVFIAVIFLFTAAGEVADWQGTEQFFLLQMNNWITLYAEQSGIADIISELHPFLPTVLVVAISLKLAGSFFFVFNFFVRFGAFCLLLFLLPATVIMHDFWHLHGMDRALETVVFLKNLAIIGGLMVILAQGKKGPTGGMYRSL